MSRIYLIFLTRHKLFQLECEVSSDRDNEDVTQQNEDDGVHERVQRQIHQETTPTHVLISQEPKLVKDCVVLIDG